MNSDLAGLDKVTGWHAYSLDLTAEKPLTFTDKKTRRVFLLHVESGAKHALSEVALLPGWHKTSEDEFAGILSRLTAGKPDLEAAAQAANQTPALEYLLQTALCILHAGLTGHPWYHYLCKNDSAQCPVAGFITGAATSWHQQLTGQREKSGLYTFKIKIGRGESENEIESIRSLLAANPGIRLRLDANQKLPYGESEAWLGLLKETGIEYLEEPFAEWAAASDWRQNVGKVAVDESLQQPGGRNPGDIQIIKPSVFGWPPITEDTVVSSSFESNYGLAVLAGLARASRPAGLGTVNWFSNDYCGPLPIKAGNFRLDTPELNRTAALEPSQIETFARWLQQ